MEYDETTTKDRVLGLENRITDYMAGLTGADELLDAGMTGRAYLHIARNLAHSALSAIALATTAVGAGNHMPGFLSNEGVRYIWNHVDRSAPYRPSNDTEEP